MSGAAVAKRQPVACVQLARSIYKACKCYLLTWLCVNLYDHRGTLRYITLKLFKMAYL